MINPQVSMIWAQSNDRRPIIGKNGTMPWYIPEDLRHFRKVTEGHTVIMGRKTWQSLPVRPLEDRRNVVLSTGKNFPAKGAEVVTDLTDALEIHSQSGSEIFIIGGGDLLTEAMEYAHRLYVTEVFLELNDGKGSCVLAPDIDSSWSLVGVPAKVNVVWQCSKELLFYRHLVYERTPTLSL